MLIATSNPDIRTIPVFLLVETVLLAWTILAYICIVSTMKRNEKTRAPIWITLFRLNILFISSIVFYDILNNVGCPLRMRNLDELSIDLRSCRLHEYIPVIDDA